MNISSIHLEKGDILVVHGYFDEKFQKLLEERIRAALEAAGMENPVLFLPPDVDLSVLKR